MDTRYISGDAAASSPQVIVERLLRQGVVPGQDMPVAMARRVARLERQSASTIERAHAAGVAIDFLGINPLFDESRLYEGVDTDWVLAPARKPADAIVPTEERKALRRLHEADLDFPLIYVAHEVAKERTREARALVPDASAGHIVLEAEAADELVGPVPPPATSMTLANKLARQSTQVIRTVRRTGAAVGAVAVGVAAAPVVLVGSAIAGLASLDPIILGAVPALGSRPGAPAAWYVLARWDW